MRWAVAAVAFLTASSAFGQLSVEEAQKRLAERQAHRQATTQSSTAVAAPARPKFDVGAYPPELRQLWIDGEAARPARIKWLQDEIRNARVAQAHLQARTQTAGRSAGPEKQQYLALLAQDKDWLAQATKELQTIQQPYTYMEVSKEQASSLAQFDSEGYITCKFTVSQIIDANNVLAFDDNVWITNIRTADLVDDQTVTMRGLLLPAGTKRTAQRRRTDTKGGRYAETVGAERTIRMLAYTPVLPIPQEQWFAFNRVLLTPHTPPNTVADPGVPPPPPPAAAEYHAVIPSRK